ncbi:hemerythrin domain-containing protein [Pleomorphovibrio marinus]|uniref:hemerythrin domain-containing protein n=1 Tax=Pleomorphovibrio marinus TaxID=2164132 RepID=UPI000E0A555F|nr:hemerythrin domain-containing protein [Pleomorphovibrio marinus]
MYHPPKGKPIKRHPALQSWSREHHNGLLLCFKVRQGIKKGIVEDRIHKYCQWFWEEELKNHFASEEQVLFPILGKNHPMVQQALNQHKQLRELFERAVASKGILAQLADELDAHIRFEERVLFQEIQSKAKEEELKLLCQVEESPFCESWEDRFWEK